MMESPAPKEAIVVEASVKSELSLGLEGVYIKSEPSLSDACVKDEPSCSDTCVKDEPSCLDTCVKDEPSCLDTCVKDEPSCSDTCVKDEPSSPEVADAPGVSEAVAAARLYNDHVVKNELVLGPELVQPRCVLCEAPGKNLLNVKQEQADPDEIAVTPMFVKQESKWEAEERNMVQPKLETGMLVASEAEGNMPASHWEPKNEAEGIMTVSHGEPKNEAEGIMPASHGQGTDINKEVKPEPFECKADDCKVNEPQNRMPAPDTLNQNGPMVFKRVWLPDSDFDDAVIGSTRRTEPPYKRVAVSRPVKPPVKKTLVSSASVTVTSQPRITAIRESRCRNMLKMFPEISPLDIKDILVKHGWNEKRSRDELKSMTRKATTRL